MCSTTFCHGLRRIESAAFDYIAFWCQHPASFAQGRLGQGMHIASPNYWCDARCFFPSDDQNHSTGPIWSFAMRGFNHIQPMVVLNRSFMVQPGASSFFCWVLSRVFLQVLRSYHVFSIPFRSQKISGAGGPTKPTKASWLKTRWRPNVAATPKAPVWSVAPKLSRGWKLPAMRGMRARTRICYGKVGSWF